MPNLIERTLRELQDEHQRKKCLIVKNNSNFFLSHSQINSKYNIMMRTNDIINFIILINISHIKPSI